MSDRHRASWGSVILFLQGPVASTTINKVTCSPQKKKKKKQGDLTAGRRANRDRSCFVPSYFYNLLPQLKSLRFLKGVKIVQVVIFVPG